MSFVSLGNIWRPSPETEGGATVSPGVRPLIACPYDIFQKDQAGHLRWCGAAIDVASAKAQIGELSRHSPVEYFVSDHRTRKMIPAGQLTSTEFELKV